MVKTKNLKIHLNKNNILFKKKVVIKLFFPKKLYVSLNIYAIK